VIRLTRLNSQQITVNSDLIKWIESTPDTVLTLINGEKILVHESEQEVLSKVVEFRRAIIAGLFHFNGGPAEAVSASANVQQALAKVELKEASSRG